MRILLTGAAGQLGCHLQPELSRRGELITSARVQGDHPCDLGDSGAMEAMLDRAEPEVIINTAAYTAVDDAEDHPGTARRLNRDVPERLARWCATRNALLVHFSTDYVFSGAAGRGWREEDEVRPVSVYGETKREGEAAIAESGARAVILRTAWLYSHRQGNFLSAILGRAREGSDLSVVDDQVGSPTWAGHLAGAVGRVLDRAGQVTGPTVFHVVDRGAVSWFEFATRAVRRAAEQGLIPTTVGVRPISSAEWPRRARRPAWSVLDPSRFECFTGRPVPSLDQGLERCLNRMEQLTC